MDRESGSIRGVYFYGQRGNLLSQRLAVRYQDAYSAMVCDHFEVRSLSPIASEVHSSGRLIDSSGEVLARFVQVVGLQRGRNVIDLSIELENAKPLNGLKDNYLANRIAWSDDTADLFCDIQGMQHPIRSPEIEAPHFVEVAHGQNRFAVLTHGLPWHRRTARKNLDSILAIGNEQRTRFKLGIAINPASTMQLAIAEMHPVFWSNHVSHDAAPNSVWWLHLANRNVVVTWIEPVLEAKRCSGIRMRLQETGGIRSTLKLYCKREIECVELESFRNEFRRAIPVERQEDKTTVIETAMAAYDYMQLRIDWANSN